MTSFSPFSWFSSSSSSDREDSSSVESADSGGGRRSRSVFSFLFPSAEDKENRLKIAMRRYGYTLAQLHSYPDMMQLPDIPQEMLQLQKHFQEELEKQKEKCRWRYNTIHQCVEHVSDHDAKSRFKYARLQECKPQWAAFQQCVTFRDKMILRDVQNWERNYIKTLAPHQKEAYLEDLRGKLRYAEYVHRRTEDEQEVLRRKREQEHLELRLKNLTTALETR
ncbi:hypothetical protein CSUI_000901 [Cystoisospora suis]|uniref:Uncharacterized protein n=1 Tax=Cystoisospora suis TaxID=483139 RepID=A0A2C6LEG9_9APIC|nr:hypothetical protein CSUI_000901 [Cystoisospora suis]